ncbi:FxsB family cyclophane-forming radical SAM/SPASM peptide maturase [Actinomadura sp. 7K507]|uniref:FxsB family cyclophane-forming radical SAM/SPASM peptide maturase n=1 Tax=Actinomadura sp. 7K507 TaxID=2530365 RepID=UPI00104AD2D7|nr:FxsB family cyclophane-forming radical SAM/SPASM peptide maturase [Actinomadura sp. 7K507]TDC96978.1 FxsB family radical SAM/SPASM domain protein [Actinomadura sp. 7K507]
MPPPALFRQFVLKVHSRCDLACDHCYVFEHADQSWRRRSATMSVQTMERAAARIAEHARTHELTEVCLVLHGGEPLLAGPDHLRALITALRAPLRDVCDIDLRMHTNGVLLDRRFCDLFREQGLRVGISLDGDRAANDRHRLYRDGRSSYDKVVRAIDLLRADYPDLYSGLLCTIDVANDPIAVYEALVAHGPPAIDFLWPHHTRERPPPAPSPAYGDWLNAIADRWLRDGRPVPVRVFDSIISTARGGPSFTEALGLEAGDLLVVETDGGYEQADSLKTAFDGAPDTGMDVFRHSVDDAGRHAGVGARQGGLAALCETCRACPVVGTCGGGLFAHRYAADGSGFANPSVFCADLRALIGHVQDRTTRAPHLLPPAVVRSVATGHGDRAAIARLGTAQAVSRRSLIAAAGAATAPSEAWEVIKRIGAADGDAYDWALSHPYVRAWTVERLHALNPPGGAGPPGGPAPDDGLLATVACLTAARAVQNVTLTVPVRDGAVYFPGIGRHEVPGRRETTVRVDAGRLDVDGAVRFEPVRRLTAGAFTVALDDLDPLRDRHDHPAAGRLGAAEFARWQTFFAEAWTLLEKEYAEYAPAVAEALTTIVPLDPPASGASASSAARDAYGSVGIALPGSPAMLCLLILHEFQHVKLGAVLDLADLYDKADRRLYHAPWRRDTRPLEGLLQGTYAHVAVADFWLRRTRDPDPGVAAEAARHFGDWYPKTLEATRTLQECGALTGLGEQFVETMRRTLASWDAPARPSNR